MRRLAVRFPVLILVLVLAAAWSCATSSVGKAVQAADVQKQVIERATVEVIKLHLTGGLSDADYATAKTAYGKWAASQVAVAESLAAWKAVSNEANEQRLVAALMQARPVAEAVLAVVGKFVNLAAVKQQVGG